MPDLTNYKEVKKFSFKGAATVERVGDLVIWHFGKEYMKKEKTNGAE